MKKSYRVVCVGVALVDSLIRGFDPEPMSASGYRAESGALRAGGEAVNAAVAAARLGLDAAVLCPLGEDDAGALVEAALRRAGVDTSLIVRSPEHPTPVTTMFVRDDGTRRSITNGAHRYNFHPERYADRLRGADAVLLGSLFRAPFADPAIVRSVVSAARDAGALVLADTKLPNFRRLTLTDLAGSLPLLDCITPNEDEARFFTGADTPEAMADGFLRSGARRVIVKLGARGCFYRGPEGAVTLPALPVQAVDATGAGDNFLAGFTCELLRGAPVQEALRFANACGAVCTTAVGAGTALQSREQVLRLLEQYRL